MSYRVTMLLARKRLPRTMKRRPAAKGILFALARRADHAGANAWPSVPTMAGEVDVSTRTAQALLEDLRTAGLIAEQAPPCRHRPRTWRLVLDAIAALPDVAAREDVGPQHAAGLPDAEGPQHAAGLEAVGAQYLAGLPATGSPKDRRLDRQKEGLGPQDLADDSFFDPTKKRSVPARTAADAAGARGRNRGKIFAGIRLQVSERQHAVVLNDLGTETALLDLFALYGRLDAELVDSGAPFDALELVKRRAREAVAAARRSGARLRRPVDDEESAARDDERRHREEEHSSQVAELWRLVDDDTRAACLRDAEPEIRPYAARMPDEAARRRSLDAAACRIYAERFPTGADKLRQIERLRLERAGAAS